MNFIFDLFRSKKTKLLRKLKSGDLITINCPDGYFRVKNGVNQINYLTSVQVANNDKHKRKLLILLALVEGFDSVVLKYNGKELENYILFNVFNTIVENEKTKEELEEDLKIAIEKEDYKLATIIRDKIEKNNLK